jgi:hypothetical protein
MLDHGKATRFAGGLPHDLAMACAWRFSGGVGTGNVHTALRAGSSRLRRVEQGTRLADEGDQQPRANLKA